MKTQNYFWKLILTILMALIFQSLSLGQDTEMLNIHKTSPVAAGPGEIITYIIEYSNVGTVEASNVVIKDYLPASNLYTYVASYPAGTLVGNVLTWDKTNIPELESLGTGIRQITVQIRAGIPGDGINGSVDGYYMPAASNIISNYTSIESDFTNPAVFGDTTNTLVNQFCGVQVNDASGVIKSATNTVLYYLLQVNNDGNIYDKFALSVFNHSCNGHDYDPLNSRLLDMSGNVITSTPWIAPHSTYQFLIELTAPIGSNPFHFSCHDITATSTICPGTSDVGNTETEILGSPKYPLVNISKIDSKDPVEREEIFSYTIFVFNSNDKYPAEDFKLYETYDANIEFVSATPAPDAGYNNVWSLGTLGYGLDSAKTIEVTVRVKDNALCSGNITNLVECSYLNQSKYPTATALTTILGHPDMMITKSVVTVPTPAVIGGDVYYTLKYKNTGNCIAENVVIKDFFDNAHLNPISLSGGIVSGGMIQWNLNTVNPGDSGQIIYSMMIDPSASYNPGVTLVRNYASISTSVPENEYNNNNDMAVFSITLLPDLRVFKSDPDTLFTGVPYTYTITIRNSGDHTASDISLADVLPSSLQFVSASDGGVIDAGKITWPIIPSLAANTDITRTVTVIPLCAALPSVINEANVSCVTLELDYTNNYVAVQSLVVDETLPEISCITPQAVVTNSGCTYVLEGTGWDAVATDNCGIGSLTYVISGATTGSGTSLNGVAFNIGTSTVTWTVTDKSGNTASCSFTVEASDIEPPVFISCSDGQEFVLPTDSGFNTYTNIGTAWDATAADNCGVESVTYVLSGATTGTGSSLDGVAFNMDTTTVLWTATDSSGNTAYCSFKVIVHDTENPVFTFCLSGSDQSANTDPGEDTYTKTDNTWDATASDNNGIASITYSLSGATSGSGSSLAGVAFNIGTTIVTFTAVDSSGNISTCIFKVIVSDNENPEFTFCLAGNDQLVNTDPGEDTYTKPDNTWDAIASDNNGIASITYSLSGATSGSGSSLAGVAFNIGTTIVTFTAVDSSGNITYCIFNVVVSDNENPEFTFCLAGNDQLVNTDPGEDTYTKPDNTWDATASDNNGIASITYSLSGATLGTGSSLAGVAFNIGTTIVTFTAVDSSGNMTYCIFNVIVSDNENPEFTFCLTGNDQLVNTDPEEDTYTQPDNSWDAVASDNNGIESLTYALSGATSGTGSSLAGVAFNIGTTVVTFTAVDSSGNMTYCIFNVVVSDNENPEFVFCLTGNDQTVSTDPGENTHLHVGTAWDAIASDNDGLVSLTYVLSSATIGSGTTLDGVVFNLGNTVVTWTAVDSAGNISLCVYNILVVDNEAPVINCPPAMEFCSVSEINIGMATATDNAHVASIVNDAPPVFPTGTTVVTWTAFDDQGNSSSCEQIIFVTQISDANAGSDEEFCQGTLSYTLSGATANNYSSLLWTVIEGSGSFVDPTVLNATFIPALSEFGNVTLMLTAQSNGSCPATSDMVVLKIDPKPELMADQHEPICSGETISLSAYGADYYVWVPGNLEGSTVEVTPMQNTVYTIVGASKEGCLDTAQISITVKQSPDVILTADQYSVYIGDEVELTATGADFSYTWNIDGIYGDGGSLTITQDTTVNVVGEALSGCLDADTVVIRILGYPALFIPEGFSPDGNGIHDRFDIIGIDAYPSNLLKVYNRWGSLVFESNGYHNEWDGNSNSDLLKGTYSLPEGTYYYVLDIFGDGSKMYSGPVYISRISMTHFH